MAAKSLATAQWLSIFDLLFNIDKWRQGSTFINSTPPPWQRPKYVTGASLHWALAISLANEQEATGLKKLSEVAHGLVQFCRGVYNEEGYHHIILPFDKALVARVLFGIAHFEDHAVSPLREVLGSILEETGRYIREGVRVETAIDCAKNLLRRAASPGTFKGL